MFAQRIVRQLDQYAVKLNSFWSAGDRANFYNSGAGADYTGYDYWWPMNEGAGSIANDVGPNNLDMTLNGGAAWVAH